MKKCELYLKKYRKLIPTLIYPFAVALYFVSMIFWQDSTWYKMIVGCGLEIISLIIIITFPLVGLICNLNIGHQIKKEQWDYLELLEVNMLIKCIQIPAYIVIFLLGLAFLLTIFTFAFSFFLVILDCFGVFLSGMVASMAIKRSVSEGVISKGIAFLCKIGSFIFCFDVIIAIILYITEKENAKKITSKTLSEKNGCEN